MASLTLRGIRKRFGTTEILKGIDLDVPDGSIAVLVGPSGCGKSTLLRSIAGLEEVDEGTLEIGSRDVTRLEPKDRDVGMVFQSYALYPHLTVRDNLAFGLKLRGADDALVRERVDEVGQMLGLDALLDRLPKQLSGGQRQRVAMGRAMARRPQLFLFDEPLSNLDAALRSDVRVQIKKLHARLGATMIYVTHDQVEAMTLADILVVLRAGEVQQVGAPMDVYENPSNRFVAGFVGNPAMNFMNVRAEAGELVAPELRFALPGAPDGDIVLGIRPQDVRPGRDDAEGLSMVIEVLEPMGFEAYAHGRVGEQSFVARLEAADAKRTKAGDTIRLTAPAEGLRLFDADTGEAVAPTP